MKKNKFIKSLGVSLSLLSVLGSVPALAADKPSLPTIENNENNNGGISLYAIMTYSRTVTKSYKNYSDIPSSISVTEYVAGVKCTGKLFVDSVKYSNGYYVATFKGEIMGNS